MRKKTGYREVAFYLSEEDYERLERYWRLKTKHRHVGTAAAELLVEALDRVESNRLSPD